MQVLWLQKRHSHSGESSVFLRPFRFLQQRFSDKNSGLLFFFCFLFFILTLRLFWLQVVKHDEYERQLSKLHYRESLLDPERGNIFALDKGGHPVKLTENLTLYDLALDPNDLTVFPEKKQDGHVISPETPMKPRFIELVAPVIYKHLCELNGMKVPTKAECVKNVELFTNVDLLPKQPELFYFWSGIRSPEYETFDFTGYQEQFDKVVEQFTKKKAMELITTRLDGKIQIGKKTSNYLGYFVEPRFLEEVKQLNLPYLTIEKENYLYIVPLNVQNKTQAINQVKSLLKKWRYPISSTFDSLFEVQDWRYIKLISWLNPQLAQEIRDLKVQHQFEKSKPNIDANVYIGIPVLYGLILEPFTTRYYPYGEFMSNILWYVDRNGIAYYGVEEYFDNLLKGKRGEIRWRTSGMAGNVWTNEFEIVHPTDGWDIYLTLDIGLQREAEQIAHEQLQQLRADAISILVLDAENGQVKASVNAPTFNPNNYNDAYTLMPLGQEYAHLIDNLSYVDVPVYIFTGNDYRIATLSERQNTGLQKFINTNVFWPQVFVDKNISSPFEPGSIFKAFTVALGLDMDEVSYQDTYLDEWSVQVWDYVIKNATKVCEGHHTFLHALIHSCNIGMVKIVQRIQKYAFYNYLTKLGFGSFTEIELAGEKEGFLDNVNLVSVARFLNNAFGQWLTVTQIQLAVAYASLVNGGERIKPTIISKIINKEQNGLEQEVSLIQERKQIFKHKTSELLRSWLWEVMNNNPEVYNGANIPEVRLGAKSWTAQISYRGKYKRGAGRTNGTFAGVVSVDEPKYVILIWVRRPRTNQWWAYTAGPIFRQLASYILSYDM